MFNKKNSINKLSDEQLKLIFNICTADSIEESIELFFTYMPSLSTVSIIKANSDEFGVNLYEPFKNIPNIEKHLYTPFCDGNVNFINENIMIRFAVTGNGFAANQCSVSFDTQTVSYLKRYYDGKHKNLPDNISSALNIMQLHSIGVDYLPYTLENLLYGKTEKEVVLDTIYSFEKLYHKNKKSDRYCLKYANKILSIYDKENKPQMYYELNELYQKIYATLLAIISIQLKYTNQSFEEKLKLLYSFMHNQLNIFMLSEINVAYHYFNKGQNYSFFGKIQKNNQDILKTIKNMSWDLFHLRFMELECKYINHKKVDMFVPYFFTYDKRLLEVKKCYELKALAVSVATNERFPFYSMDCMSKMYKDQYFNSNAIEARRSRLGSVEIEKLISKYEELVTTLVT